MVVHLTDAKLSYQPSLCLYQQELYVVTIDNCYEVYVK